jgi:hypothetical protein
MFHPTPHKNSAMVFWPVVRSLHRFCKRSWSWTCLCWQNKKTHKQIKKKQNKTSKTKAKQNKYTHCDFLRNSKCGKNILWLFPVIFFSTDATHTYNIILNTDTISILIPYSQWWAKNCERNIFTKKRKTIRFIIFVNGFHYTVAILLNAGLI